MKRRLSASRRCSVVGCGESNCTRGYCLKHLRRYSNNNQEGGEKLDLLSMILNQETAEAPPEPQARAPLPPAFQFHMSTPEDVTSRPLTFVEEPLPLPGSSQSLPSTLSDSTDRLELRRRLGQKILTSSTPDIQEVPGFFNRFQAPTDSTEGTVTEETEMMEVEEGPLQEISSRMRSASLDEVPPPGQRTSVTAGDAISQQIVHTLEPWANLKSMTEERAALLNFKLTLVDGLALSKKKPKSPKSSPKRASKVIHKPKEAVSGYLFTSPSFLLHDTTMGITQHIESPQRLRAVLSALLDESFSSLEWRACPIVSPENLEGVHDKEYLESILTLCLMVERGLFKSLCVDPPYHDSLCTPGTREAVLRAAGGVVEAVKIVLTPSKITKRAFCAVRPPGHHAEMKRSCGFCFINNVAVGAVSARRNFGLSRVAVVDFDTHHGNGTQDIFQDREGFFYGSFHREGIFPLTAQDACQTPNIFNAPVTLRSGRHRVRQEFEKLLSALDAFRPELLMISAGFDAHKDDPVEHSLGLTVEDFEWMTDKLVAIAEVHCAGKIVSVLEGGYNIDSLAKCAAAHVARLMS